MDLERLAPCPFCDKNRCTEKHHFFPKTKINIKTYGKKLIDSPWNTIDCCNGCNGSHTNIPKWAIWREKRFRIEAIKRGCNLPPGTKSYQNKLMRRVL